MRGHAGRRDRTICRAIPSIVKDHHTVSESADVLRALEFFESRGERYPHRLALSLSQYPFQSGLCDRLKEAGVKYARVPVRTEDTVYYLFRDTKGLKLMGDLLAELAPGLAPRDRH